MEVKEMALTLKRLELNFNKKMSKEQKIEWYDVFKDEDVRYFIRGVKKVNRNNKFFPTIYEMLGAIESQKDEMFTEKEKIYHMKKLNITPKWLNKKSNKTLLSKEEYEELKKILEEFK